MTWATIILAVMAILAFLVSVFAFFQSRKAFVLSRQANELASGANTVAEQARKDAKAAPAEAERRKLYRVIHDQIVRMHEAITKAWVHDQSRPVGSPPDWYPDALRHARSAHAELPEGHLASLLPGEFMNYENVASAWQRMGEAEQRRCDLDREVNSTDRNQPSHAQTQLVEANWVLRDRRVAMMEYKDRVDGTVKTVSAELRKLIYATD